MARYYADQALGMLETVGMVPALEACDKMLKAAEVKFLTWEKKLGGRLVTCIIQGEVSAVTAAVESAKLNAKGKIVASAIIANPHEETMKLIEMSMKKHGFLK